MVYGEGDVDAVGGLAEGVDVLAREGIGGSLVKVVVGGVGGGLVVGFGRGSRSPEAEC